MSSAGENDKIEIAAGDAPPHAPRSSHPASEGSERAHKRRPRWWKHVRRRAGALALPIIGPTLLRVLAKSWRVEVLGREHLDAVHRVPGRLLTLWHGRMLVGMPVHPSAGVSVLVSPSDDGSLVVPLLERFGFRAIRGSTFRRPAQAVRAMLAELERGGTIVLTPDGPRGPRHAMNAGPAWMAKETGFPVLALGCACDRAWRLASWDRFTIPKPGARVVIVYETPIVVPRDADELALARATDAIRSAMLSAEERGFAHLGVASDW